MSILALIYRIDDTIFFGRENGKGGKNKLLYPHVEKNKNKGGDWDDDDDEWYYTMLAGGVVMVSMEIAGWVMFYIAYKDSLKYGEYLLQSSIEAESDSLVDAGF